jgi:hypothetical protein
VAVEITPLGFKKPDGAELVRGGDNVIADNAQKAQDLLNNALGRLGVAEATIKGGLGVDIGLSEDPLAPGTYFMADTSPITEDPDNAGLYTF